MGAAASAALVAALLLSHPGNRERAVEIVASNRDQVTFANRDGRWTIFLRCLGPRAHGGRNLTVGPGYVARVVRGSDGAVITNDVRPVGGTNAPGAGGLGELGWHGARRHGRAFGYD